MKFFSYALVYAFVMFLLYGVITFVRFAYVRIKAYATRRKLAKLAKLSETETKKDG